MRFPRTMIALSAAVLLAACANQQEPAEQAFAKIEANLNEIRTDAQQYASEQLQTVEASVNRLKEHLAKQDYSTVVQAAPSVSSELQALKESVTEAKANAEAVLAAAQSEWAELNETVPPMVDKLQVRVDQLSKSRKYPTGMDKASFEAAKSGFESLKTEWTEAGVEFTSGEAGSAVRKARNVKAKAEELINQLEIQV